MTAIEETKIKEVVSNMDTEQMQTAIKCFPIQIVFNELERREQERIDLLNRLDELSAFVGSVTR
jgi:diketogulonate reductase-like aldo/keto reductase